MPFTAKEKMQRYRAKLKSNEEKYEKVKRKNCERKVAQKIVLSEIKKENERVRNRERVRKHLAKEQTKCCPN